MIKLIVTDLDGTLLNNDGKINDKFYDILKIIEKRNILFIACSGRFYSTLDEDFKNVKSKLILAAHNGSVIQYSKHGECIFESKIKQKSIIDIVDFCDYLGIEKYLCTKEHAYISNPSIQLLNKFKKYRVPVKIVKDLREVKKDIFKIGLFNEDGIKNSIIKSINEKYDGDFEYHLSGDCWFDIMNIGVNKGNAVKTLQNRFNISKNETMVFGDFYNDISMFKYAQFSYAMKNAPEDVKKHANFIAKSNNENGVLEVIEEKLAIF